MPIAQSDASTLITRFLESLYERQDLAEHLDCYHPDAWVLLGPNLVHRGELEASTYEGAIAALFAMARPGTKPARFELLGEGELSAHGTDHLAMLPMRDRNADRTFTAAFHLRREGAALLFQGCVVLTPETPVPTLETIDAAVAAALSQTSLVPDPGEILLTPLDLAYRRAFPVESYRLLALPETRFTCQHSGHCCTPQHDIPVPRAARQAIEGVDWRAIAPSVPLPLFEAATARDATEESRLVDHGGTCGFRQDGGCVLHAAAGYAPLAVCATYPVDFTATPDGICLWTYFTCPTVRANIGEPLLARHEDMSARVRLWRNAMLLVPDEVPLVDGVPASFHAYATLEEEVLSILARSDRSPRERAVEAVEAARIFARQAVPESVGDALGDGEVDPLGVALYLVLNKHLPEVFRGPLALGDADRLDLPRRLASSGVRYAYDNELITRYLRQVVYRKKYLPEIGVVGHVTLVAWVEGMVRWAAIAQARVRQ